MHTKVLYHKIYHKIYNIKGTKEYHEIYNIAQYRMAKSPTDAERHHKFTQFQMDEGLPLII